MRLLLCAIGDAPSIFVKTHILPLELTPAAHVTSVQSDEVFDRAYNTRGDNKQQISELYTQNDIAVCLHVKTLKQQYATSWAQTVSKSLYSLEPSFTELWQFSVVCSFYLNILKIIVLLNGPKYICSN